MDQLFTSIAGRISHASGQPAAFIAALFGVVLWALLGPVFQFSETWQLVVNTGTTIITFLMVFVLQNSQNRDAGAMQAKLDELIRAVEEARGQFIGIEHLTDKQIREILAALEAEAGQREGKAGTVDDTVARLLGRY